jgi:hypothetical protein
MSFELPSGRLFFNRDSIYENNMKTTGAPGSEPCGLYEDVRAYVNEAADFPGLLGKDPDKDDKG